MLYFLTWGSRVSMVVDAESPEKARARAVESDPDLSADELVVVREIPVGLLAFDVEWPASVDERDCLIPDVVFTAALLKLEDAGDRALEDATRKAASVASTLPAPPSSALFCRSTIDDGEGRELRCQRPAGHDGAHHEDHDGMRSEWESS